MNLPNIEVVSAKVHEAWMDSKRTQGVSTRKAEDGEELMAPYEALSEKAKELDRGTVKAVYDAIEAAQLAEATAHVNALMGDDEKPESLDAFARAAGYPNYQAYEEARDTARGR